MGVRSLGQEDPLEEGMATHSSILAWRIPWTEEPDELQSMGSQRVRHDWACSYTRKGERIDLRGSLCRILGKLCHFCEPQFLYRKTIVVRGCPGGSDGKESACKVGDPGSILGSGRPLEEEMATHSSILAWWIPWTEEAGGGVVIVHGVTKSQTWLRD